MKEYRGNEDGPIKTYSCEKGIIITFIDENEYKKCERAIKQYLIRTYKELVFKVAKDLKKPQKEGDYELELFTDESFKKVYGSIKLKYYVKGNAVVIKEITPNEILRNMHSVLPKIYKGVPYTNAKELMRIKIILG